MSRIAAGMLAVLAGGLILAATGLRAVPDDPAEWHVDPTMATRPDTPNDYMVAPRGLTRAAPDRISRTYALSRADLMAHFDEVATASARTHRIAGSTAEHWASYVQRSRIFGFPDYVSVRAVEVTGGSALVVWSRSRFGYNDMGVNRARVEHWLSRMADRIHGSERASGMIGPT